MNNKSMRYVCKDEHFFILLLRFQFRFLPSYPRSPTATPTPNFSNPPVPDVLPKKVSLVSKSDINHLYRRAGLGAPPDEAYGFVGQSVDALVDYFMTYRDEPSLLDEARTWLDDNVAAPHYPAENVSVNDNGVAEYVLTLLRKNNKSFPHAFGAAITCRSDCSIYPRIN